MPRAAPTITVGMIARPSSPERNDQIRLGWQIEIETTREPSNEQMEELRIRGRRNGKRQIDRGNETDHRLPEQLRARRQALGIAVHDLAIVVDPADGAEAQRDEQNHPDEAVAQVRPQQRGDHDRYQDQRAAHRWRAGLREMRLRAILAYGLTDLVLGQLFDHLRPYDERDHQRGHGRQHRTQRDVTKNVECAHIARNPVG